MLFRIVLFIVAVFAFGAPSHAFVSAPASKKIAAGQFATKIVQVTGKKLIAPSAAARIAQGVAPASKLLNVRLSRGGTPRYVVKTRSKGRLRTIVIDAKTGSVVRR